MNLQDLDLFIKGILFESKQKILSFSNLDHNNIEVTIKSNYRDLVTEVDRDIEAFIRSSILKKFPAHTILGEESFSKDKRYKKNNLWVVDPIDGTTNFVKQKADYVISIAYFENDIATLSYVYDIDSNILYSAMKGEGVYKNGQRLSKPENVCLRDSLVSIDVPRFVKDFKQNQSAKIEGTSALKYEPILKDESILKDNLLTYVIKNSFDLRYLGTSGLDGIRVIEGRFGAFINPKGGPWDYAPFILMAKEMDLIISSLDGAPLDLSSHSSFVIATQKIYEELPL